jgi:rRNA maturation RNase YbeY
VKSVSVRQGTLRRVTRKLLRLLDEAEAEVCIGLVGETRMRRLNRTYRHQDRTTDVLAFAYREARTGVSPLLGDVAISVPTARRQAKALSHSLDEEVLRLLIHGVLHLVGYDHERSRWQARRMRRKETELFETFTPLPSLVVEA